MDCSRGRGRSWLSKDTVLLLKIISIRTFQLIARPAMPQDVSAWGRVGVGAKPCRGGSSRMMLCNARRQTDLPELHQQLLLEKCCLQPDPVNDDITQWHLSRGRVCSLHVSQNNSSHTAVKAPQAASPVLMTVSQNQSVDKL